MKKQEIDKQLAQQEKAPAGSLYGTIITALEEEPMVPTSHTLTDGVLHKLSLRKEQSKRRYWLFVLLITTSFVVVGFGSLVIFMGWESFREIKDLSIYGILIGLMVVLIQYLDDKLLKRDLKFS
ncbi:MAG: hypothetical protein AAGA85_18580 [Bacteroidota bacterium]